MVESRRRWPLIALALLAGAVLLFAAGLHFGTRALKTQVEAALGAEAEVGEIRLAWNAVEVLNLRLRGAKGWPAEDSLRARRIRVEPDFLSFFSGQIRVAAITVEGAYVSALRSADGRLRVVPSLLERNKPTAGGPAPAVHIGSIVLADSALEFFDATVRQPPLPIRLQDLQVRIEELDLPTLSGKTQLHLDGTIKGIQADGNINIDGWMELASRESELAARFRGVDLVALQPYLIKAAETGVKKGRLDLDITAAVHGKHLHAPGTVALSDLELDAGTTTFLGLPRQAVIGLMKDRAGRIKISFVLDGDLDDPQFRLNESIATRFAAGFAETLGISVEGLVKGVGSIGQKSVEVVGGAAKGVGQALKGLFD